MSAAKFRIAIGALVVIGVFLPALSAAQNLGFLKDAPISFFDEKDMAMLMEAIDAALNEEHARATREWKNPDTGNSGKAEVLRAFKNAAGTACKRLRVTNLVHNGVNGRATYTLCKETDKWMVVAGESK